VVHPIGGQLDHLALKCPHHFTKARLVTLFVVVPTGSSKIYIKYVHLMMLGLGRKSRREEDLLHLRV